MKINSKPKYEKKYFTLVFVMGIISVIYKLYEYVRNRIVLKLHRAPKYHDARVKKIQKEVRKWDEEGCTMPMCTARPSWLCSTTRASTYKKTHYKVAIDLIDILEVNTEKRYVRVEPMVNMGQLSEALCPLGWIIPIVPEFESLTVGGMINGTGIETSSHSYGLFQHICLAYELVLADGSLVRCTKDENTDLFHAVPWSHGTLGFLVAAEIMIIPCKKYVKLQYIPLYTIDDVINKFTLECTKSNPSHFVEGIVFSKNTGVIMMGQMTDHVEEDKVNRISRYYKPSFYKHVETFLGKGQPGLEYIPTRDYFHRHTRSYFWEIQYLVPFANHIIFRYLFGWMLPFKVQALRLFEPEGRLDQFEKEDVLQDMLVPLDTVKKVIEVADDAINVYPIWLCGVRIFRNPGLVHTKVESDMYVDVGLYGRPMVDDYEAVKTTRHLEACVHQLNGFQMLYAHTYMTEKEFRDMFDHTLYDQVRNRLNCKKAFPEVYKKVCSSKACLN